MANTAQTRTQVATQNEEELEKQDWIESLEAVVAHEGPDRASSILKELQTLARKRDVQLPAHEPSLYVNTIPVDSEPQYPGDLGLEKRICALTRWNALAMVVRANREESGIGGHISTFASCATLYQVGYSHFIRGRDHASGGDHIYFQGHASPGNYARAFLEGRLTEEHLKHFRREVRSRSGLSSYPHPWLMPDFWEFPTVSMGLGPIQAIYRARFIRYLENRGLKKPTDEKVWAFVGDGECDEPETLGSISLAPREKLDNLIFVVNCNLQRLDGPVRGNGKIIQELETIFGGMGWNVIKVIWGSEWDELFKKDTDGVLVQRLTEIIDGDYQKIYAEGPPYLRKRVFNGDPRLEKLIEGYSDEQLRKLRVGGHDPKKIYAAYKAAVEHRGRPTVILAKTVKGYGLGEAGEGKNITHQQKKMNEKELAYFRDRLKIPISDEVLNSVAFYRPPEDSPEIRYVKERRQNLGGFVPRRKVSPIAVHSPEDRVFEEFRAGTERPVATTMALVHLLGRLLHDPNIGKYLVPIVPDEARTFGMDALFRQCGIYSSIGQLYEPVDRANVLYYKETRNGQLLEEGITEAGSMSSFIAAGTAYAMHRVPTIPFFFFYSMFGFQRIGDLIWAAGDIRARGFLIGGTAGRTTLAGEGLQHQDGHSHVLAQTPPNLLAYDPAFAYEIAVIVQEGIHRMFERHEDLIYYLTTYNEVYPQPKMPDGSREGILKGMYKLQTTEQGHNKTHVHLFGSGPILNEVLKAQALLMEKYGVASSVWSVTSYKQLRQDALDTERWNWLHPEQELRQPYITQALGAGSEDSKSIFIAASDYMKAVPDSIAKWLPGPLICLGTDGFGRSDSRRDLRRFFEVDINHIAFATLSALFRRREVNREAIQRAAQELQINQERESAVYL